MDLAMGMHVLACVISLQLVLLVGCEGSDHSLLDANRTALVVVDVQADFLTKLPLDTRDAMVGKIAWLMRLPLGRRWNGTAVCFRTYNTEFNTFY